jgi:hypothetical protein
MLSVRVSVVGFVVSDEKCHDFKCGITERLSDISVFKSNE